MIFPTLLAAVALLPSASATYYATSPPTSAPTSGSLNSCYKQKHCMHATMTKSSPSKCSGCGCEYTVCLTVDPTKHSCTDNKVDRFCYGKSHICQNSVWDWNDYRWEFPGHSGPTQKSLSFSHSKTKCQTGRPGERLAFLVGDGDNCYGTDHLAIPGKGVHLSCSQYYYGRYPSNDDCGGTRWKQCAWEITLPLTCGSTPHPTANPTPQPTANPTPQPTANPTPQPTANPTPQPTANPTPCPTANPTPHGQPHPAAHGQPHAAAHGQPHAAAHGQPHAAAYGQPDPPPYGQPHAATHGQPYAEPDRRQLVPGRHHEPRRLRVLPGRVQVLRRLRLRQRPAGRGQVLPAPHPGERDVLHGGRRHGLHPRRVHTRGRELPDALGAAWGTKQEHHPSVRWLQDPLRDVNRVASLPCRAVAA